MQFLSAINKDHFHILALVLLSLAVGLVALSQTLAVLLMAALLALAVVILYFYRPNLLIYSMLFVAPFHFFVTEVLIDAPRLGASLSLGGLYQDIWPVGLAGIWLLYGITSGKLTVKKPPAFLLLLLFAGWAILHIVSLASPMAALFGLRNLLRFALLPFIIPMFATSKAQIRHLFLAAFLGMALASAISLAEAPQFISNVLATGNINLATIPAHLRFVGIFGSARQLETAVSNTLGISLALMATYGLGRTLAARSPGKKIAYLLCSVALAAFVLLTFSRRGYFTLLFGPLLLLWLWQRSLAKRARMFIALATLFMLGIILLEIVPVGDLIIGRSTTRVLDNPSFAGRQYEWRIIWEDVTESPFRFLWGYGMASTGPAGVRFGVPNAVHAHNYYLMIWHQLGLVGLILFLAVLGSVTRYGFRVARRFDGSDLQLDVWYSVVVVVVLALNGLLGTTFEAYPNDLIFWTAIGVLAAAARLGKNEMPNESSSNSDQATSPVTSSRHRENQQTRL